MFDDEAINKKIDEDTARAVAKAKERKKQKELAGNIVGGLTKTSAGGEASNVSQTNTFNIDGSKSPEETADAIQNMLTRTAGQLPAYARGK